MKVSLTKHGKRRLNRRLHTSLREKEYIKRVLQRGINFFELPLTLRKQFHISITGKCIVYAQAVHFFTNKNKLITTYHVPAELIPEVDRLCAENGRRLDEKEKQKNIAKQEKVMIYMERRKKKKAKNDRNQYMRELRERLDPLCGE